MKLIPHKSSSEREATIASEKGQEPRDQGKEAKFKDIIIIIFMVAIILLLIVISILLIIIIISNINSKGKLIDSEETKFKCPKGFFLVENEDFSQCLECKVNNCKECQGDKIDNLCTSCKEGYEPEYNDNNEIIYCKEINGREKYSAPNSSDKNFIECQPGYYVPNDSENNYNCEKCSLENCEKCNGEKNNNFCISCKNGFFPKKDENDKILKCIKKCQTGNDEKCKECDNQNNICLSCNSGFYIPNDDELKIECKSCSINNCKDCHGTKIEDICDACESNYQPEIESGKIKKCKLNNCEIGEEEKCLTCNEIEKKCTSCNPSYALVDGKCEPLFTFKAVYLVLNPLEYVQIIDKSKIPYIKEIYVDGEIGNKNNINQNGNYKFENTGEHNIKILLEITSDILVELFHNCKRLISVKFNTIKNDFDNNIKITSMQEMLLNCEKLISIDISKIETKYVENISYMAYGCSKLTSIDFSKNNFENVVNASYIFAYDDSLTNVNLGSFQSLEYFNYAFYKALMTSIDLSLLYTYNLKDISRLFYNCYSLKKINLNDNFYTEQILDMRFLFYNCSSLTSLNLSSFDTKNVRNMSFMFNNCSLLESINMNNFDTSNVISMYAMFNNCSSLISIDITKFKTENTEDMAFMFNGCFALKNIDLSQFKTNKVNNMKAMFQDCQSLTSIDVSNFDTSQVTEFRNMFFGCTSLTSLDISKFNFEKYISYHLLYYGYGYINYMICYCNNLTYLDISSIESVIPEFFEGLPSNGKIRCKKEIRDTIINTNYLIDWEWIII